MSLLAPPAYYEIEDRIDAIGQKYRVQRLFRGMLLWVGGIVVASFVAAMSAHFLGVGFWTRGVFVAWCLWILVTTGMWIVRPLLIRPDPVEVARFIESRIEGLHNGLTNGLLLSRREDLAQSPWLVEIFNEILQSANGKPLGNAVKIRDLGPLGLAFLSVVTPLLLIALIFPRPFVHGWHQLFHATTFVPQVGMAELLDVQPKDVTVIAGQPVEITVTARCPGNPKVKLIFEKGAGADATAVTPAFIDLIASTGVATGQHSEGRFDLQYTYRMDHVDQPMRYRVEVAGTQSPWYSITLVRQVRLQDLQFHVQPPSYTHGASQTITIKSEELSKANLVVPQGSRVDVTATVDVSVGGAMLEAGTLAPASMEMSSGGKRFSASFPVLDETPVALLLMQGGKQVVARLPEESFVIHCLKDQPPVIEMKWPTQDASIAPNAEVKVHALFRDDYGVAPCARLAGERCVGGCSKGCR